MKRMLLTIALLGMMVVGVDALGAAGSGYGLASGKAEQAEIDRLNGLLKSLGVKEANLDEKYVAIIRGNGEKLKRKEVQLNHDLLILNNKVIKARTIIGYLLQGYELEKARLEARREMLLIMRGPG